MVRQYQSDDELSVRRIHVHTGFDYKFPDLNSPLFHVKKVVEEDGEVRQCLALQITACIYLWVDPTWGTPAKRLRRLKRLVQVVKWEAKTAGLDTIYAVIPPEIEKEFSEVLAHLGMTKDREWPKWSLKL